ncbi:MAG: FecR domain-containing protein [Tannerellaceae bacterium]|jgi:ferric-dicitrate binding protein FerR (iron transport regulator)|nr:FecR domain-containing protein [Tannerellaceae bacterium]
MYTKKRQQLQNIWEVAGTPVNPEDIDLEKAYDKVMSRVRRRKWYQSTPAIYWQRTAAILLLPLTIALTYMLVTGNGKDPKTNGKPVYMEVTTPYGMHTRMNLPDGSVVWLNAGSMLKYPAAFAPGIRNVYLSGEAYFEVESNEANPFVVETENMKVQATGTAFNVEAYLTDSLTSVTMVEGKVTVDIRNAHPLSIEPGQRMEYNLSKGNYEIITTDAYKWYAWKDGKMVFRDDPLEYVFKKIGQTFNVEIIMNDTSIGRHPYRATFEGESLDEILRLLRMTAPIRYIYFDRKKNMDDHYLKQRIEVYRN